MNAGISPVLSYGSLMLVGAVAALVMIVRRDLIPAGALGSGGRIILGAALGLGIVAFTIKLAVIATLSTFPGHTIDAHLPDPAERLVRLARYVVPDSEIGPPASMRPVAIWEALPATAPAPADNPTTPEKVALGELLFHDRALSFNRTISCASCHDVRGGAGDDGKATAVGITKIPGKRNTPTVFNAAFQARLFWDGRAGSLEEQALGPIVNPDEMGMPSLAVAEGRVRQDDAYREAFDRAFGEGVPITIERIAQSLASYQRSLVTADTPYDRFVGGDETALSESQKRGMWLFRSVGCATCHSGPNFSGASQLGPRSPYQRLLAARSERALDLGLADDKGRAGPQAKDGVWRVPTLRNIALTAPYFHNGAVAELSEAVRLMAITQLGAEIGDESLAQVWWSPATKSFAGVKRKRLSERDIVDIVEFLHALSSERLVGRPK